MSTLPVRIPRDLAINGLLAVLVAAAQVFGTELIVRASGLAQPDTIADVLLVAIAAPLVVRDRYPVPALLAVAAMTIVYTWLGLPGGFYTASVVLAISSAVAMGHRLTAVVVGLVLFASILSAGFVLAAGHAQDPDAATWLGGWLVAAFVFGEVSRSRREYIEQVEQRAIDAERTREEEARRRAGEERLRIARELHDVLAHNISMINVQAGVAVHLLEKQPEQARTALVAISHASKEALRELRATLGVLRQVDDVEPRDPAPGLARLDELVARTSAAGLSVTVEAVGDARPLPPATDLAAYRIIQESLTNVARHSDATSAAVSIRYGGDDVVIEVEDDGQGAAPGAVPAGGGNGLIGMRERAHAAGGELEAGPRPDGGFRVRARLPAGAGS